MSLPAQLFYNMNISECYVKHWTVEHAFRELYTNWMDASIEKYPNHRSIISKKDPSGKIIYNPADEHNKCIVQNFIEYDPETKVMILENELAFEIKCLLMGCTSKQKSTEALGQFGEGMKLTMILMLKSDICISIESGKYSYFPQLKKWQYEYENKVLRVEVIQKQKFQNKTRVKLRGITPQQFQEMRYISLALLGYDKLRYIKCGNGTLVFPNGDPKLIGRIYKKGVLLELHEENKKSPINLDYSYDFKDLTVGRDRDCVNDQWDLYSKMSQLHFDILVNFKKILQQNFRLEKQLDEHTTNVYNYLAKCCHQTYYIGRVAQMKAVGVSDMMYKQFLKAHNKKLGQLHAKYVSCEVKINAQLRKYGLQSSFYPSAVVGSFLWPTLSTSKDHQTITKKINRVIQTAQERDMNTDQECIIKPILENIKMVLPQIKQYTVKIKELKQVKLICYKKLKIIYVNKPELRDENLEKVKTQIIKMLIN